MSTWRPAAAALVADLTRIFASRLRSVVAYGARLDGDDEAPLTCLALVESIGLTDLEACARRAAHWERQRVATPLILAEHEFRRSLDAFPLEYGEIIRAHERVFGPSPFDEAAIAHEDLRRACEAQVKSHLLHLREAYVESGGQPRAVADLVATSAPAFAALLRHVARLGGSAAADRTAATVEGGRAAGLADGIVGDVLALEQRPAIPTTDAARLFPEYLAAVERLARVVDGWRT